MSLILLWKSWNSPWETRWKPSWWKLSSNDWMMEKEMDLRFVHTSDSSWNSRNMEAFTASFVTTCMASYDMPDDPDDHDAAQIWAMKIEAHLCHFSTSRRTVEDLVPWESGDFHMVSCWKRKANLSVSISKRVHRLDSLFDQRLPGIGQAAMSQGVKVLKSRKTEFFKASLQSGYHVLCGPCNVLFSPFLRLPLLFYNRMPLTAWVKMAECSFGRGMHRSGGGDWNKCG